MNELNAKGSRPLQGSVKGWPVIIVGTGETAAIALEYFRYDSPHEVVAFSTEAAHLSSKTYCELPVVPLEALADTYSPEEYQVFVAISATQLNQLRRRLYDIVKVAGYTCASYISSHAFVLGSVEIGENTFVQEHVALQAKTRVGNNVFLGSGTCIGHGTTVADDCYFGPGATVAGNSVVGRRVFVGAGSTIGNELSIAEDCIIGGGAVVLKDTVAGQVYLGNPARPTARHSSESWPGRVATPQ
jgi:sugar O-acyltransferase (sialic acid O-acetyltransferase NeuD family)